MSALSNEPVQEGRFTFIASSFPENKFAVISFRGCEAISRLYSFDIDLVADDPGIDNIINKNATFSIRSLDRQGEQVLYHGIITEFEQSRKFNDLVFYRAVLMPRMFNLTATRMSEIYLDNQTVPDVITEAIKDGGLTANNFRMQLIADSYRPWSYICQYDETCFNFISRLMEREGIYYYFQQGKTQETLIIVDNIVAHAPSKAVFECWGNGVTDEDLYEKSIQTLIMKQKIIPTKLILKDYNYRKSTLDLTVTEEVSANGVGEILLYGENYRTPEEGKGLAKIRAQEMLCREKIFTGESSAIGLVAGYFITLKNHYRNSFNQDYLVTEVSHEGAQDWAFLAGLELGLSPKHDKEYYKNSFTLVPSSLQFRPERLTAKPRINGTMNAHIDAEGTGEYAELDDYGRYKVQLPFDKTDKRDGKASAWLRMATPYAGTDHGMYFPLLKGTEVLLTFIDGDPDMPVIASAVPSSTTQSLIKNSNMKMNVIKTAGGNQIALGDDKSSQHISLWSPFHSSGIAIGSTEKGGGGSLDFTTKGNMNQLVYGLSNTFTIGAKSSATVGAQFNVSLGTVSALNLTQSSAFNITDTITYNVGDTYTLGAGKSYNLKPKATFGAVEAVTVAAGLSEIDGALIKTANKAVLVALLASAAGVGGAAVEGLFTFDDDGKRLKGGEAWKAPVMGVLFLTSLALALGSEYLIKKAAGVFDSAVNQGRIGGLVGINKTGVNVFSFGADTAVTLQSPGTPITGGAPGLYSKLEMKTNAANLSVATADADVSVSLGQGVMEIVSKTTQNNGSGSGIRLTKSSGMELYARTDIGDQTSGPFVDIQAAEVKIWGPGAGATPYVSLDANKIIISGKTGQAGINVTDTDVIVKGAGGTFKLTAGGIVAVAGNMIKLG